MSKLEIPLARWSHSVVNDLEKCEGQRAKRGNCYAMHHAVWATPPLVGGRIC